MSFLGFLYRLTECIGKGGVQGTNSEQKFKNKEIAVLMPFCE